MHVAAHVDAMASVIVPALKQGKSVILDRYWWSTYAYSRGHLSPEEAWDLVRFEKGLWMKTGITPVVLFIRRPSLPGDEVDPTVATMRSDLGHYYDEVISGEREEGITVEIIDNTGGLGDLWKSVVAALHLE